MQYLCTSDRIRIAGFIGNDNDYLGDQKKIFMSNEKLVKNAISQF